MISRANTAGMVATEGGAALTLETDPELQFNEYTHDFVADKGCCTRIGLEGDDVDEFWFHTLRIFGLRKGYTIDTDLPGHYLLNTFGLTEEEEAVQAYSLPALLHPIDAGQPALLGLRWKIAPNGNIYAMCVPTDLKLATDVDAPDKYIGEGDVMSRRLNLFKRIEYLENKDGNPLGKKFDSWCKDHSAYFDDLKVKSLAASRAWLSYGNFVKQFDAVNLLAQFEIKKQVTVSCGGQVAAPPKKAAAKRKPADNPILDPTAAVELKRRLLLLQQVTARFALAVKIAAVPVGNRFIEVELDPANEAALDDLQLMDLLKSKAPHKATELFELLKNSDKFKLINEKKGDIDFSSSPLPHIPVVAAGAEGEAEAEAAEAANSESESELPEEGPAERRVSKRPKTTRSLFDSPSAKARAERATAKAGLNEREKLAKAKPAAAPTATIELPESSDASSCDKKERRKYIRSGLFSSDPVVAAAARAAQRGEKPEKPPEKPGVCTPPPAFELNSAIELCCRCAQLLSSMRTRRMR